MNTKTYEIRAGHGSMRQSAFVEIQGNRIIAQTETPFGVHDEAIRLLLAGQRPSQVKNIIQDSINSDGFSIDIWESDYRF